MTCPVHNGDDDSSGRDERDSQFQAEQSQIDRREFMKSALMIGGGTALSTTLGLTEIPEMAAASGDPVGIEERLNRQHAWDTYEYEDPEKGTLPPPRHVLLMLDYQGEGEPSAEHRRQAQQTFRELESTLEWDHKGLLFTIGYSPSYFNRFDEDLPDGVDPDGPFEKPSLITAETLINAPGVTLAHEDPVPESDGDDGPTYDACLHLASNHEQNILAAEELLWGGEVDVDDDGEEESLDHTLEGVFGRPTEYPDRRVGFAGTKNLINEGGAGDQKDGEEEDDIYPEEVPVDDGAKLSMGFNDLFKNSIPREDLITLLEDQHLVKPKPPGVFAQGTVQHVSKLDMNLDPEQNDPGFEDTSEKTVANNGWYQFDDQQRINRMFSPEHDVEDMGVVGENLGSSNAPKGEDATPIRDLSRSREAGSESGTDKKGEDVPPADIAERTQRDAETEGVAGHVQKCARARFNMETRVTDDIPDDYPYVTERDDDLRGHDGNQEAEQIILRRDFNTVDNERPGLHFVSLMRFNPYMAYMRQAMNGVPFDSDAFGLDGDARIKHDELDLDGSDNGIAGFCKTQRRGNYLVPPLTQRALPHPTGNDVEITVEQAGENVRVEVEGITASDLEDGSIRFGRYLEVNAGGGVGPKQTQQKGDRTTFIFPAEETHLSDGVKARLFAKRKKTGRPVRGTATVQDSEDKKDDSGSKERDNKKGNKRSQKVATDD